MIEHEDLRVRVSRTVRAKDLTVIGSRIIMHAGAVPRIQDDAIKLCLPSRAKMRIDLCLLTSAFRLTVWTGQIAKGGTVRYEL